MQIRMGFSRPVLVAVVVCLMVMVARGSQLNPAQVQMVDNVVQTLRQCSKIEALSLSYVSLKDNITLNRAYWTPNPSSTTRVNDRTAFCIGGATQAFTAVLLAKLIDENENVTWDTPIQNILSRRVNFPTKIMRDHMTLKDIFAMRSGISGMDIVPLTANPDTDGDFSTYLPYAPVIAGFREKYIYNEVLFSILFDVVKEIGGSDFYTLMRQHIFQPLGMKETMFLMKGQSRDVERVKGVVLYNNQAYALADETYRGMKLVGTASSICISADDMSKWLQFLLEEGRSSRGTQVIKKEVLQMTFNALQIRSDDMNNPETTGYSQPDIPTSYSRNANGLGWINGQFRGYSFISQDGSLPGYQALATIVPSRSLAVYVGFIGDEGPKHFAVKVLLNILGLDILMQGNTWITKENVCSYMNTMASKQNQNVKDPYRNIYRISKYQGARDLDMFVGHYRHYGFGDVHVVHNTSSTEESFTLQYSDIMYRLEPTNINDTFQMIALHGIMWYSTSADWYRDNRMYAVFIPDSRDPEGRTPSVTIIGFDKNLDPVFHQGNRPPPRYEESRGDDDKCGVARFGLSMWLLLLMMSIYHLG